MSSGTFDALDFVVLDLETTGLSRNDEVVEAGAVRWRAGRVGESWVALCRPEGGLPEASVRIHGITDDLVRSAPPFAEVLPGLRDFLGARIVVGHHARFDHAFLDRACRRAGLPPPDAGLWCTVRLSRRLFPELPRHDLDSLCVTHGIRRGAAHRALDDARATADLLGILLERAEALGWSAAETGRLARPPGPAPAAPRVWQPGERAVLEDAMLTGDRIRLEYVSRRGIRTSRDVVPYSVAGPGGGMRLVAYDLEAGTTRTFRLDRVVLLRPVS